MSEQEVIVGRCLGGSLVAYLVPPHCREQVWKDLNQCKCIVTVWEEPLTVWRNRRIKGGK